MTEFDRYQCCVCNYIYNPEFGDPENGETPWTPFQELPDYWLCPRCGALKSDFDNMEG